MRIDIDFFLIVYDQMNYFRTIDTDFDMKAIDKNIVGAGILPIAMDILGEWHMLLGKERYIHHWRGSLKWSGFEGGRKYGENVESTAAREFIEESMGVVPLGDEGQYHTQAQIAQMLQDGKFCCKFVLCIQSNTEPNEVQRYHVTYLVQLPYNANYPKEFENCRAKLLTLQQNMQTLTKFKDAFKNNNLAFEGGDADKDIVIRYITNVCAKDSTVVLTCKTSIRKTEIVLPRNEKTMLYHEWFTKKECILSEIKSIGDEIVDKCISIKKDEDTSIEIKFNEDYIEKLLIKWWSIDTLQTVLSNGGCLDKEQFRAYFLPVLKRCIMELVGNS